MSKGINKAILIGNLGADPESRHMPSGGAVTNLRIATAESWKDKQSGDKKEKTEWHSVVCFGRLAEIAAEYLSKGRQVYVEGRIQARKWQDKEGNDRYTTEIVASELQMLGGRDDGHKGATTDSQRSQRAPQPPGGGGGAPDDFPEDVPFVKAMSTEPRP